MILALTPLQERYQIPFLHVQIFFECTISLINNRRADSAGFSGVIPSVFPTPAYMEDLSLANNTFSGAISSGIFTQTTLKTLCEF